MLLRGLPQRRLVSSQTFTNTRLPYCFTNIYNVTGFNYATDNTGRLRHNSTVLRAESTLRENWEPPEFSTIWVTLRQQIGVLHFTLWRSLAVFSFFFSQTHLSSRCWRTVRWSFSLLISSRLSRVTSRFLSMYLSRGRISQVSQVLTPASG